MDNNQATISNDPAANAPDAAAYKGKGKAVEDPSVAQEMSMDEDESEESENENEELAPEDEDEDGQGGLEPISSENILSGGRRTRGKNIDFQRAADETKNDGMDDEDEDEDFAPNDNGNNANDDDDDQMRD